MAEDWHAVADAVRARRIELGMKERQDLAERAGVHLNTIGRIERAVPSTRRSPSWAKIEAALAWPPGHVLAIAEGRGGQPSIIPAPAAAVIRDAVLAAVATIVPDVTAGRAGEIADEALAELRRRGALPPDTAGLTPGSR
jgi:transcriptional regulator with XRE-family HTH domain